MSPLRFASIAMASESTVMCGVERAARYRRKSSSSLSRWPLCTTTAPAVAHGVVVVVDRRDALGVSADVEDRPAGALRDRDVLHELAQAHRLLVHLDGAVGTVVAVPGGVGAALGDARQQQPGEGGPVQIDPRGDGETGDSAHDLRVAARSPIERRSRNDVRDRGRAHRRGSCGATPAGAASGREQDQHQVPVEPLVRRVGDEQRDRDRLQEARAAPERVHRAEQRGKAR